MSHTCVDMLTYTHVPNITRPSVTATKKKVTIINNELHTSELQTQLHVIGPDDEIFGPKHAAPRSPNSFFTVWSFHSSYVFMGRCGSGGNILLTWSPKLCWWVTFWPRDQRLTTTDPAMCSANSHVKTEQLSPL
jgi:hypothetical protein